MEPVIQINNASVDFKIRRYRYSSFKEWVMQRLQRRNDFQVISALKNINLTIQPGESVAFIGHNGSGKSTLLKVLAGVIELDTPVIVRGRLGPMIELGTGFDPELNGIENIRLACTLMGITQSQIDEKIEPIVKFSELEDFIHVPFKNYSSGMQARLGFACTTAIDPDVLLVDEVLAVGDSNFARKCLERIHNLQNRGCTIVMVSHDENTIRKFCQRAIVLEEGALKFDGSVTEAFELYHEIMDARYEANLPAADRQELLRKRRLKRNDADPAVDAQRPRVSLKCDLVQGDQHVFELDLAKPFSLDFLVSIDPPEALIGDPCIGIALLKGDERVGGVNSSQLNVLVPRDKIVANKTMLVRFQFERGLPQFMAGEYNIALGIHDRNIQRTVFIDKVKHFSAQNSALGQNHDEDLLDLGSEDIRLNITFP